MLSDVGYRVLRLQLTFGRKPSASVPICGSASVPLLTVPGCRVIVEKPDDWSEWRGEQIY